jgi:hypothetical protein
MTTATLLLVLASAGLLGQPASPDLGVRVALSPNGSLKVTLHNTRSSAVSIPFLLVYLTPRGHDPLAAECCFANTGAPKKALVGHEEYDFTIELHELSWCADQPRVNGACVTKALSELIAPGSYAVTLYVGKELLASNSVPYELRRDER